MNEYVIDLDLAQDYTPPPKVYPKYAVYIDGGHLGNIEPVDEKWGFKIGEKVKHSFSNSPYDSPIAYFFTHKSGFPSVWYENKKWDCIKDIEKIKE